MLDGQGRFRVEGGYLLRAFPIAREILPADLSGVVEGWRLKFAIAVNDTVAGEAGLPWPGVGDVRHGAADGGLPRL